MSWTGLTSESKQFCSYKTKSTAKKIRWWFVYVFNAAPKFWFYTLQDKCRFLASKYSQLAKQLTKEKQ
jgi:hypothetical protein